MKCCVPLLRKNSEGFNVRVPGRFTHTKPRWGGHEPHRGNSTRGPPKTPRQQQKNFKDEKPGAQNQAEGIPPGDLQKPPATAKTIQGRKTRAHKNHTEGIPPGDRQNPRGNSKICSKTKNEKRKNNTNKKQAHKTKPREFHQGTDKKPRGNGKRFRKKRKWQSRRERELN